MLYYLLKSKLHRATVTDSNVNYEGSLTVSLDLMRAVGFLPYERVLIGNMTNGERFETYLIVGKVGKGEICLNGATAHLGKIGHLLTIMSFIGIEKNQIQKHRPKMMTLLKGNKFSKIV